ncbi:unnamed protein product [Lactuca saligna]|uniref:Uncharacterized protein n=1 Tax=Lactuca saligna TaxID=75948 RepID=A0AA36DZL3_LACSI|nr:unnamed protein product [Lactuca saligna]
MACNKRLDFAQLFFDQLVECITGNKTPSYVLYPHRLVLILACTEKCYNLNHRISINLPALSSKIINASPIKGFEYLTQPMEDWLANPFAVESSDSDKENDE